MNLILRWIFLIVVHVILPLVYLWSDSSLISELLHKDEWTYAYWMIGVYAIPGIVQALNWIITACMEETSCREFWFWIIFSLFFPISIVIWNIGHAFAGPKHFDRYKVKARSKVLNSISTLTKSPLQLLIQITIVLLEWKKDDGFQHFYQTTSLVVHGIILTFHLTENYLFQVTGKGLEKIANVEFVQNIMRVTFCNMIYILARLLVFSFLLMYGRTPCFVSVGFVFVVSNFLLAWWTLRTKPYKNCFTAFAAIIVPGGIFFSRDTFQSRERTQEKFKTFSFWNSIIFLAIVTLALFVMLMIYIFVPDYYKFTCDNIPPFTYSTECKQNSLVYDAFGPDFPGHPQGGYLWASFIVWLSAAAQTGLGLLEAKCF